MTSGQCLPTFSSLQPTFADNVLQGPL